jgi:predicted nucleotide-binding protein (sugar kinase/HSP70/actin superfamily)
VHTVKIRYDKRFVKKNLKIFFPPTLLQGEKGNSSSLSYNCAVITRTPELPAPAVVGMLKINF